MKVAVVDSGGANIASVCFALQRLGVAAELTGDAAVIRTADRVLLPGVGAAAPAMARLRELNLVQTLREVSAPLLGICLGMQLLFDSSDEGDTPCLGLLPGQVGLLPDAPGVRIPHMGWNTLEPLRAVSLLDGVDHGAQAYFVHSYAAPVTDDCIAACTHSQRFAAMVQRGHVAGAQFHPERSASTGARVLRNFLEKGLA
ncbi:MAG: imidazole glycerol phosphate synthase subunit HisH [Gammaproteobacteria bacterium HGW-Gammaproteobacteria-4]|jgi:glutamine amidotransferase|nr:MAG: imidazole glycerol phosphate synthase subunit HisH [Gammaproteobacteria bacterium HGW-Gammaproteobacteria-4]